MVSVSVRVQGTRPDRSGHGSKRDFTLDFELCVSHHSHHEWDRERENGFRSNFRSGDVVKRLNNKEGVGLREKEGKGSDLCNQRKNEFDLLYNENLAETYPLSGAGFWELSTLSFGAHGWFLRINWILKLKLLQSWKEFY